MQMRDLINIVEDEPTPDDERVAAIGQLLIDKTEDENTESKLNTQAFINMANKMGVPMSLETLMDMATEGDLQNIIADVNQDEITFKGRGDVNVNAAMTVDKARNTVDKMAKRNAKKGIHK